MKLSRILLSVLCRLAISKDCSPTKKDDLDIDCYEEDCVIHCKETGKIPENNLDYVRCNTDTGLPEVDFPAMCITPRCSSLSPPPGLDIQCYEGNRRCEFSCRNSGRLIGPKVVYCNDDGAWSGEMPTCGKGTMAKCPSLESPYAIIKCTNGASRGSTCTFSCEKPRFLKGGDLPSITCEYSNNQLLWSGSTPSCQLIEEPETTQETPQIDVNCDETETIWSRRLPQMTRCNSTVVGIGVFLLILIASGITFGFVWCINACIRQREDEQREDEQREDEKNQSVEIHLMDNLMV